MFVIFEKLFVYTKLKTPIAECKILQFTTNNEQYQIASISHGLFSKNTATRISMSMVHSEDDRYCIIKLRMTYQHRTNGRFIRGIIRSNPAPSLEKMSNKITFRDISGPN